MGCGASKENPKEIKNPPNIHNNEKKIIDDDSSTNNLERQFTQTNRELSVMESSTNKNLDETDQPDEQNSQENKQLEEEAETLRKFLNDQLLKPSTKMNQIQYQKFMIMEEDDEFLFSQNYDQDQIFDYQRIVNLQNKNNWEIIKNSSQYNILNKDFKKHIESYINLPYGQFQEVITQKNLENSTIQQIIDFQDTEIYNLQQNLSNQSNITTFDDKDSYFIQKQISSISQQVQGQMYILSDINEQDSNFRQQFAAKVFQQTLAYEREKNIYIKIQKQIKNQQDNNQYLQQIIPLSGYSDASQCLYFSIGVMNLNKYLEVKGIAKQEILENEIWYIMIKIYNLITYLHSINIYHSDIKPANIQLFISNKNIYDVKLSDFGAATDTYDLISYSPPFYPQNIHSQSYKQKYQIELFSLGRICYFMMLKSVKLTPYFSSRIPQTMNQILNEKLKNKFSNDLIQAVNLLLNMEDITFYKDKIQNIKGLEDTNGEILNFIKNQRQKQHNKIIKNKEQNLSFQQAYAEINITSKFNLIQSSQISLEFLQAEQISKFQDMISIEEFQEFIINVINLQILSQEYEKSQQLIQQFATPLTEKIQNIKSQQNFQIQLFKQQCLQFLKQESYQDTQKIIDNFSNFLEQLDNNTDIYKNGLCEYQLIMGSYQQKQQQNSKSLEYYMKVLQQLQQIKLENQAFLIPNQDDLQISSLLEKIALINQQEGNLDKAIQFLQECYELRKNNIHDYSSYKIVYNSLDNLLKLYMIQKNEENINKIQQEIQIVKQIIDQQIESNENLAENYHNLALASAQNDDQEEALEYINKALDILDGLGESNSYEAITYLQTLGTFYRQLAEYDAAQSTYKKAQVLLEINFPEKRESSEYANILNHIATCHLVYEEHDEAEEYFLKAVSISEKIGEKDQENLSLYYYNLALVYKYQIKYEQCIDVSLKALELNEKLENKSYLSLRKNAFTIGTCHMKLQQKEEGKKYLLKSLEYLDLDSRNAEEKQDEYLNLYNELGFLFFGIQQPQECIQYMEKAITFHEIGIKKEKDEYLLSHLRENYINSLRLLAFAYKQVKNLEKFVDNYIKAIECSKLNIKDSFEELEFISDYNQIAMTYVENEQYENAEKYYKIAFETTQKLQEEFPKESTQLKDLNFMISTLYRGLSRLYEKTEQWEWYEEIEQKNLEFKENHNNLDQEDQLIVDYINLGVYYQTKKQDIQKAEELYKKGYALAEISKDEKKTKIALLKLNQLFMGKDSEKYVFYALKYIEFLNKNQSGMEEVPGIYVNLGNAMYKEKNYDIAVDFLEQAIKETEKKEQEENDNLRLVITIYEILNLCFEKMKENTKAIETQMKILELYEKNKLENDEILANMTFNLAYTYNESDKIDFALEYLEKAGNLAKECLSEESKFSQLYQIATIYAQRNKFKQSLQYLDDCVQILEQLGSENKIYQENFEDMQSFKANIETIVNTLGGETDIQGEKNKNEELQEVEDFDI